MAAEWTPDDVRAVAPEFAAVVDATLNVYIGWATPQINPDVFGDNTVLAGALLTAHLLTRFPPSGVTVNPAPVGPVSSETVGQISVSYAVPQTRGKTMDALASTRYGLEFSRLAQVACASPTVL